MSGTAQKQALASIHIDRLTLEIPGFDPAQAGQLSRLVASHLAHDTGWTGDMTLPRVAVTLSPAETSVEQIAWKIARAIFRARPPEEGR
ncbi:MAG TPA: hypothetical protein VEQ16_10050 [Acidocella sp.]|jgi:hypothetical protein|nr:hypothetical protein [Acidocella sp.]